MKRMIAAHVAPIARKVRLMIGRCVVKLVNDAALQQELQVQMLADEVRGRAEHFQPYGFTSHPHPGAEGIAASVAGNRSHTVVLVVDDRRYRKKDMQEGECALYTDEGDYILLKRGRIVEVNAGAKLNVIAPEAEFSGNVTIDGNAHVKGSITCDHDVSDANGSMQEMRDTFNSHTHSSGDPPDQEMT